jgi:hypothetical protein
MGKVDRILLAGLAVSLLANVGFTFLWLHGRSASPAYVRSQLDARTLPHAGARLDNVRLLNVNGEKADLRFDPHELPIVVYVLSPTCKWCKLNKQSVDSLAMQLRGKYRFVGVSTTSQDLAPYVTENAPPFPVYYVDSSSPHSNIPLTVTPETLVFSADGAFVRGWNGAFSEGTIEPISSYFGVKLPDVKLPDKE